MESEEKVEIIKKAIAKLMMEEDDIEMSPQSGRRRRRQLLNKLLSELEEEETDEKSKEEEETDEKSKEEEETDEKCKEEEVGNGEIVKELKNVQRQNRITHYLVTAMIVITLGWQLSEVSLMLRIKHGLTNPFKSVGEFLVKGFRGQDVIKAAASDVHKHFIQPAYLPDLNIAGSDEQDDDDDDDDSTSN